ncbi:MAG: catalase family peroxidase [Acidobacteriota bacterium]
MTITAGTPLLAQTTSSPSAPSTSQPSPEDAINALNGVFGRHPEERSSHAKGFCAAGHFAPSAEGRALATTPLFAGTTVPVTARFSIGGGNPKASDTGRSVRGLGLRFHLTNGERLDLVMISAPVFFAATPQQFVEFLQARTADPATGQKDPARIRAFNEANPNVMPHLDYLAQTPPPASYATTPYYSTHAFLFSGGEHQQAARWVVRPVGGFVGLTEEQEKSFPESFLELELRERLTRSPARWEITLILAEEGDPIDDPTAVWPAGRREVIVGQLTIDLMVERGETGDCTNHVFDPNNLPTGITATDDPILALRSPAYAISLARRSG